jgi:hypothetical protein
MVRFVEQVAALLLFDASGEKCALRSAFASVVSTPAADEASVHMPRAMDGPRAASARDG